MTEAGEKWIWENFPVIEPEAPLLSQAEVAEWFIKAFCVEVERRASQFNRGYEGLADWCVSEAFNSLKRELLGG